MTVQNREPTHRSELLDVLGTLLAYGVGFARNRNIQILNQPLVTHALSVGADSTDRAPQRPPAPVPLLLELRAAVGALHNGVCDAALLRGERKHRGQLLLLGHAPDLP